MSSFDSFFDESMLDALHQAEAEMLPLGDYRMKIDSVSPETITSRDGTPIKSIVIRGTYADDGEPLNLRFQITMSTGEPNRFALRELGQGLIESGIKRSLPDICALTADQLPVVMLKVYEEKYTNAMNEEKTVTKKKIGKCADQSFAKPKAMPLPPEKPQQQEEVSDERTPF